MVSFSVSAAAQSTVDADTKEIQSYRLTLTNLNQFVAATRNVYAAVKSDPRFAEVMKLQNEKRALQAKEEPTEAEMARMDALDEAIDAAQAKLPKVGMNASDNKSLSEMEASIRQEPLMLKALTSAGMSPRDYLKFTLAFFQAAMIQGMQKAGVVKEIPKELQATVNMENIKFVEENQAAITKLMAEFEALNKQ